MNQFKTAVKRIMTAALPERAMTTISCYRSRNHQIEYLKRHGIPADNERFTRAHGTTVSAGPFQGMLYPALELGVRPAVPYLIGSVESELHGLFGWMESQNKSRPYDCALNIGCAEGYYAVGLSRLMSIPVYAFDPEFRERKYCRMLARANRVDHLVTVKSWFSESEMRRFAPLKCVVICDCEGHETTLFNPRSVKYAEKWDIIIELHGEEAESRLPALFEHTHCTKLIPAELRRVEDYPVVEGLLDNPGAAISENRPLPSYWLWARSRRTE